MSTLKESVAREEQNLKFTIKATPYALYTQKPSFQLIEPLQKYFPASVSVAKGNGNFYRKHTTLARSHSKVWKLGTPICVSYIYIPI